MALTGYGLAAALVAFGPYPGSMIGMPGAAVSNMAPPTVALLAVGFGQIGLALALRGPIVAFARWPGVSWVLGWAGRRMMTVYLWHMSALFVITSVVVVGLGVSTPSREPRPGCRAGRTGLLMLFWRCGRCCGASPVRGASGGLAVYRGDGQDLVAVALVGVVPAHVHGDGFVPGPAPCSARARSWWAWRSHGRSRSPPGRSQAVTSPGRPDAALWIKSSQIVF